MSFGSKTEDFFYGNIDLFYSVIVFGYRKKLSFLLITIFILLFMTGKSSASSLSIEGESYQFDKSTGIYVYKNPRIESQDEKITANSLIYDSKKKIIRAKGDITLFMEHIVITGDEVIYDLSTKKITVHLGTLMDSKADYFVTAKKIERVQKDKFVVYEATFTKCDPVSPAWEIYSSYAVYYVDDYTYARNMVFSMYSAPIIYTPFMAWTTKRNRGSGFLAPKYSFHHSSNTNKNLGNRLRIPLFLDLAEYHDVTFTTDLIERRGVGVELEYNYAFTEGMLGQLQHWRIQEHQPDDKDFKGEAPYRSRTHFQHRQSIFWGGNFYLNQIENSDNEVNKEYFDSTVSYDWDWSRSANAVFQWSGGGVMLSAEDGAKYSSQSVRNKENDADTHLNRLPELSIEHNILQIGGTQLSTGFNGTSTWFERKQGWRGVRNIGSVELSYPFHVDFINIVPNWSRRYTHYQVGYEYESEVKTTGFTDSYSRTWRQDSKMVEVNFELFRTFSDQDKTSKGRLSLRPRIIYEEVEDVDQRGALNRRPDQYEMTNTPADYEAYEYMFDGEDYVLGRKLLTYRFDVEYRQKSLSVREQDTLFKLSLIQMQNLSRGKSLEEINEKFKGPQIKEEYQETRLGNQNLPLRVILEVNPNDKFSSRLFFRYDHEEKKIIDTHVGLGFNLSTFNSLSMTYMRNTKSYQTPDGSFEPAVHSYSLKNNLLLGEKFSVSLAGVWDFTRFSEKDKDENVERLDRNLIEGKAGLLFQHDCYTLAAQYNEKVVVGTFDGEEREYLDRSVTIKFSLTDVGSQRKIGL